MATKETIEYSDADFREKMSGPKSRNTTKLVPLADLTVVTYDPTRPLDGNVRAEGDYQIPAMVASLRRHGFRANHPIVVNVRADGTIPVLQGNRRVRGLLWLRDNEPETLRTVLPAGKVPAIVHENLTREDETLIRIDHGSDEDRVGLSEFGIFQAVAQLVASGVDSQALIAAKLGFFHKKGPNKGKPNRSYIQPRVNLARLPQFVQSEYKKLTEDKTSTRFRLSMAPKLYKLYTQEFAEYRDGSGPLFQAAWQECLAPPADSDQSDESDTSGKALQPGNALQRAQACNSTIVQDALLEVTGQGNGTDLATLDAMAVQGETAVQILTDLRLFLNQHGCSVSDAGLDGVDFDALVAAAAQYRQSMQPAEPVRTADSYEDAEPVSSD